MLVQFPTNARSMIVPPPHMPGAPSVEALKTVVEGLPFFGSVVEDALTAAADMPVKQPQFKGQN